MKTLQTVVSILFPWSRKHYQGKDYVTTEVVYIYTVETSQGGLAKKRLTSLP